MAREDFQRAIERELTGREQEPSEWIYFKVYKSQIPVIEQAIETNGPDARLATGLRLGSCLRAVDKTESATAVNTGSSVFGGVTDQTFSG